MRAPLGRHDVELLSLLERDDRLLGRRLLAGNTAIFHALSPDGDRIYGNRVYIVDMLDRLLDLGLVRVLVYDEHILPGRAHVIRFLGDQRVLYYKLIRRASQSSLR